MIVVSLKHHLRYQVHIQWGFIQDKFFKFYIKLQVQEKLAELSKPIFKISIFKGMKAIQTWACNFRLIKRKKKKKKKKE